MKRLRIIVILLVLAGWVHGYTDYPPTDDAYIAITRGVTSVTGSQDEPIEADAGWDYGDDDPGITQAFGGSPFEYGKPLQIEFLLSPPPPGDAWAQIRLEYYQGTNAVTTAWELIRERTTTFESVVGVPGAHLGLLWTPPAPGPYLIRVMGVTVAGLYTGLPTATGITAKGDGLSWNNHAVVGVWVQDRARPSYGP